MFICIAMSKLEGNPYINWKKAQFKFNGQLYECQVKAMECNICNSGIAYILKFSNKVIVIGHVGDEWHQLNNPTALAKEAGIVIDHHVSEISKRDSEIKHEQNKKHKGENFHWGENASKG